jgi:hypothetical protein
MEFLDAANAYQSDFTLQGFTAFELANETKVVTKSFFKFNFYDSPDRKQQKMVFSSIMPLNNCLKGGDVPVSVTTDPLEYYNQLALGVAPMDIVWKLLEPEVRLKPRPGLNENYYIQWFKKRDLYEGNVFYMSCQFFNAKTGKIIRMINESPPLPMPTVFNFIDYYYYEVILKIEANVTYSPRYNYKVRKYNALNYNAGQVGMGSEVGTGFPPGQQPIKFYEYVNP